MIIGNSKQIQELKEKISIVASSSASILILGETGTGKELVAEEIHKQSGRIQNKIVKVNCAAIQDTLLESELFGHVKGAFTSAHTKKVGKLTIANKGTLVLDEISNMSLAIQAKILRAVEYQNFEMVGGLETHNTDARIIAISNKDLIELVQENKFREDLYYRLAVVTIHVPSLRNRVDDVPILTNHFIKVYSKKYKKSVKSISYECLEKLKSHPWKGNVRELKNVIESAVIFSKDNEIKDIVLKEERLTGSQKTIEDTVYHLSSNGYKQKMENALNDIELTWIISALEKSNYIQCEAAKLLGITPRSLCYKIKVQQKRTGLSILDN